MEKADVIKSLKAFVATELLEGDDGDLDEKTPLLELKLLDSFSIINLLSYFESEFGVEIPIESLSINRLKDLDTMADLVIESKAAA